MNKVKLAHVASLGVIAAGTLASVAPAMAAQIWVSSKPATFQPTEQVNQTWVYGSVKGEPLWHQPFSATIDGKTYQTYCLNYNLPTPVGQSDRPQTPSKMELDVLYNGYPNVSYQSLGLDNTEQAMSATQIAEWIAAGNFSFNDINWNITSAGSAHVAPQASRDKVKAAVQKILQAAQNDPRQNATPAGQVNYLGQSMENGNEVIKVSFSCSNGYSLVNPVTIDLSGMPSDIEVTQDGKQLHQWSQVQPNKEIDVIVKPGQKLTSANKIGFHANCNQPAEATLYYQQEGGKQNALVYQPNIQSYVPAYRNFENISVASPAKPTLTTNDNITGKTGMQSTNPDNDTAVTDNATMTNLTPGAKYTLTFNETENGQVIKGDNGQPVTVSKTFTADKADMTVSADLPKFDTTKYNGKTLTIQSTLKDASGKVVATDNGNKQEQITISSPKMETQALINGQQNANPNGGATIFDKVSFSGVTPGEELNFKVIARDQAGQPIVDKINGKNYYLEGNVNYTPTGSNGTINVPLEAVNAPADAKATSATANSSSTVAKSSSTTAKSSSVTTKSSSATTSSVAANSSSTTTTDNSKWAATTASEDAKNITIKPITLGESVANPTAAAKQAGGSDLANPYAIDTDSLAGVTFGLSETMSDVNNTNTTSSSSSSTSSSATSSSASTSSTTTNSANTTDVPIYHHGPSDSNQQTASITSPALHTEALIDDKQTDNPRSNAQLYDKVTYSNVVPGQPLELSALEYNKATGKPVVYDGNQFLAGRITFVPKTSSGTVLVPIQAVAENTKDMNALTVKSTSDTTAVNNDDNAAAARINANNVKVLPVAMGAGVKTQASLAASQASKSGKNASEVNSAATSAVSKVANVNDPAVQAAMLAAVPTMSGATSQSSTASSTSSKASSTSATSTSNNASSETSKVANASSKNAVSTSSNASSATSKVANASSTSAASNATSAVSAADNNTSAAKAVTSQAKQSTTNMSNPATKAALSNGGADVIDTTKLRGIQMVAVEDLSTPTSTNGTAGQTVAKNVINSEANMNNNSQTVHVTSPAITTDAAIDDKQALQMSEDAAAGKKISYTDTINYKDFTPGEKVKFTAVAMNKATGKPVKLDNKYYLVGTTEITPTSSNGTAKVTFSETTTAPATMYTETSNAQSNATSSASASSSVVSSATSSSAKNSSVASSTTSSSAKNSSVASSSVKASVANASSNDNIIQGGMNSYANATSSKTTSSSSSADSVKSSATTASASSTSSATSDNGNIPASDLPEGKNDWVAFETAQNVGSNTNSNSSSASSTSSSSQSGDVIAEDHNLGNKDETVQVDVTPKHGASTATAKESSAKASSVTTTSPSQTQSETASAKNGKNGTNGTNGSQSQTQNETAQGQNGANGTNGKGGSQSQNQTEGVTAANGKNGANGENQAQNESAQAAAASPRFAQTSGTKQVSHNWFYNFIYNLFH